MTDDKNFIKDLIFTLFKGAGIAFVLLVILLAAVPRRRGRTHSREKACYANMRVLLGAVEMYNMDNTVMMTRMNKKAMNELVVGKYLRRIPVKPEADCEYRDDGKLTDRGVITCRRHGTVEGPPIPPPTIWDKIMSYIN